MTQPHLAACPSCARHVRVSESACPFCRAALSDAFRATPARQAPRARLTRAALFALGTGVALTPACSSSSSGSPGEGTAQPLYGAPGIVADGGESAAGSEGNPVAEAGAGADATPGSEGTSDAATDASSGTEDGGPSAQPLYGATAHEDGGSFAALYGLVGH